MSIFSPDSQVFLNCFISFWMIGMPPRYLGCKWGSFPWFHVLCILCCTYLLREDFMFCNAIHWTCAPRLWISTESRIDTCYFLGALLLENKGHLWCKCRPQVWRDHSSECSGRLEGIIVCRCWLLRLNVCWRQQQCVCFIHLVKLHVCNMPIQAFPWIIGLSLSV